MNTENKQTQNQQQSTAGKEGGEPVHISQPQVDRAEGPFEHSGETSGWTKEEEEEKTQQEGSNGQ